MTKLHHKQLTILIADDTPANVDLLAAILSADYSIKTANRGSELLDIARKTPPDLILLDIMMPEMNGYDICRALKADKATRKIPVFFVTSLLNPGDELRGFEAGCVDYITKPVNGAIVRTRVKAHLDLKDMQNRLEIHQLELEAQNEELQRTQDELELSRNKYAELYDFAPVGYFTFDEQGHIQQGNLTGAQLLGVDKQLLGNIPFNLFIADADGRSVFSKHLEAVLTTQDMQRCEIRLAKRDGTVIYGSVQSVMGGIIENRKNVFSTIIDCTVAKQLETKILDAREYAESIVETVRKPLVVLNSELKVLTANRSFYDTFMVTPGETIENPIYELGNRQWDIAELRALFDGILLHHTVFNDFEVEHEFPNIGRKIILLNAREIFQKNSNSHIILLAMEDITERKLLEVCQGDLNF